MNDIALTTAAFGGVDPDPSVRGRLLILGGTREAADLARMAVARLGGTVQVITSLAGRLLAPPLLAGHVRVGGFGGVSGLVRFLEEAMITHVIDATHPFATKISRHAREACARTGLPHLVLQRPAWRPEAEDRWYEVDDFIVAAWLLPQVGRRPFLTIGPGDVAAFTGVRDVWFLVRLFEPPTAALPLGAYGVVVARPPFNVDQEVALMRRHRIDLLVTKNSGGPTEPKLTAARTLNLPVLIIRRPPPPDGRRVETVEAALDWLASVV